MEDISVDVRPAAEHRSPLLSRSWLVWLFGLCSYLPLAALGYLPVWTHWSSQLNGCNCWDQILQEWFIHWTPSAIVHGHSVLVTNYIDAPNGINVMWNASVLGLGALASPLTQTIGVVHTMAILMTLSIALSASAMFILLRRWIRWLPAAWLGGLVYGFSTFALEESSTGRVIFVFMAIPPLIILAIDKLIQEEWSPIKAGTIIGVLTAAQLFVSEEILAITTFFAGLVLLILALLYRTMVGQRLMGFVRAAIAATITFTLLTVYPLYVQFLGPDRITGPPQSHAQLALFSSDLASIITPGRVQWINFAWTDRISGAFSAASAGEVTFYIGLPLLLLLLASIALLHTHTLVRIFAPVALFSFWCSMGPHLLIGNHHTHLPGIDALLVHVPILGDIVPSRFAVVFWFSIAVLFAVALEEGHSWLRRVLAPAIERRQSLSVAAAPTRVQISRRRTLTARLSALIALLVGIGVLIPIVPAWPYEQRPANVPPFFTTQDVQQVPSGSLIATYPYPITGTASPMLWQAESDMRYRMLGGYAIGPGPDGTGTFFPDPNPIEYCLNSVYSSGTSPAWLCHSWYLAQWVRKLGVTSVIAGGGQPHIRLAVKVLSAALGAPPRYVGGVWLWRCTTAHGSSGCRWS